MTRERVVKCPGRFSGLREYIHNEAVPLILEDRDDVRDRDLRDIWDLISGDVFVYDLKDPYYNSHHDTLRKQPNLDYLSLVPLFSSNFHFEEGVVEKYALSMGNRANIVDILEVMPDHPKRFFKKVLRRDPNDMVLPSGERMTGYYISGNFGIGTASPGGVLGGGIRSDSPFLLEVYKMEQRDSGESNLAAVIGFWVQDNTFLVSQMQSCKNAKLPEKEKFGVVCLSVAETAARLMGFDKIMLYNARGHPIFKEHPDNWAHLGADFTCVWDNSAKKLGYNGSRNGHHEKGLRSS